DDILYHVVDLFESERAGIPNRVDLGRLELSKLADDLPTLVRALLVEAGHVGALHWLTGRGRGLGRHKGIASERGRTTERLVLRSSGRRMRRVSKERRSSGRPRQPCPMTDLPSAPFRLGPRVPSAAEGSDTCPRTEDRQETSGPFRHDRSPP